MAGEPVSIGGVSRDPLLPDPAGERANEVNDLLTAIRCWEESARVYQRRRDDADRRLHHCGAELTKLRLLLAAKVG